MSFESHSFYGGLIDFWMRLSRGLELSQSSMLSTLFISSMLGCCVALPTLLKGTRKDKALHASLAFVSTLGLVYSSVLSDAQVSALTLVIRCLILAGVLLLTSLRAFELEGKNKLGGEQVKMVAWAAGVVLWYSLTQWLSLNSRAAHSLPEAMAGWVILYSLCSGLPPLNGFMADVFYAQRSRLASLILAFCVWTMGDFFKIAPILLTQDMPALRTIHIFLLCACIMVACAQREERNVYRIVFGSIITQVVAFYMSGSVLLFKKIPIHILQSLALLLALLPLGLLSYLAPNANGRHLDWTKLSGQGRARTFAYFVFLSSLSIWPWAPLSLVYWTKTRYGFPENSIGEMPTTILALMVILSLISVRNILRLWVFAYSKEMHTFQVFQPEQGYKKLILIVQVTLTIGLALLLATTLGELS